MFNLKSLPIISYTVSTVWLRKGNTCTHSTTVRDTHVHVYTYSLQKALVRSVCAYKMNCELAKKAGEKAGLDLLMLGLLRRKALLV